MCKCVADRCCQLSVHSLLELHQRCITSRPTTTTTTSTTSSQHGSSWEYPTRDLQEKRGRGTCKVRKRQTTALKSHEVCIFISDLGAIFDGLKLEAKLWMNENQRMAKQAMCWTVQVRETAADISCRCRRRRPPLLGVAMVDYYVITMSQTSRYRQIQSNSQLKWLFRVQMNETKCTSAVSVAPQLQAVILSWWIK